MARMTAIERLEARGTELAAMPGAPEPTAIHQAAVDALTELVAFARTMQSSSDNVPPLVGILITTMEHGRPMLLDSVARVPEIVVRDFMAQLAARIQAVVDVPISEGATSANDDDDDQADAGAAAS